MSSSEPPPDGAGPAPWPPEDPAADPTEGATTVGPVWGGANPGAGRHAAPQRPGPPDQQRQVQPPQGRPQAFPPSDYRPPAPAGWAGAPPPGSWAGQQWQPPGPRPGQPVPGPAQGQPPRPFQGGPPPGQPHPASWQGGQAQQPGPGAPAQPGHGAPRAQPQAPGYGAGATAFQPPPYPLDPRQPYPPTLTGTETGAEMTTEIDTGTGQASRRALIAGTGVAVVAAAAGFVWYTAVGPTPRAHAPTAGYAPPAATGTTGTGTPTELAEVADIPEGGGIILDQQSVVLTRESGDKVHAFSAVCTHQGCLVSAVSGGRITCPCHGSTFDANTGAVIGGPAPSPLPAVPVTVVNGSVYTG